jgi:hypothetical protein
MPSCIDLGEKAGWECNPETIISCRIDCLRERGSEPRSWVEVVKVGTKTFERLLKDF